MCVCVCVYVCMYVCMCVCVGMDIILNRQFIPYLLEVNRNPSLNVDTPLDVAVKGRALNHALRLVNRNSTRKQTTKRSFRGKV